MIAVAMAAASPFVGWDVEGGLALGTGGGLLTGGLAVGILGGWLSRLRAKWPVEAMKCIKEYNFNGKRGRITIQVEEMQMKARVSTDSFTYSNYRHDGRVTEDTIEFKREGQEQFMRLNESHKFITKDKVLGDVIRLYPPGGLKRGDKFRVKRRTTTELCFEDDNEYLEKRVLFPIKEIRFNLTFDRECFISVPIGTNFVSGLPVPHRYYDPLELRQLGNNMIVEWIVQKAKPGEYYRIVWRWQDAA